MTKEETKKILFVVKAAYPENYIRLGEQDLHLLLTTWAALLADYSYSDVSAALQSYLVNDTYGRAPKIGQIIEAVQKMHRKDELNANEAWALVYKAIGRSSYYAEEEFNKLPPVVQKAVGSYRNLQDYASMNISDVQVTVKAHFKSVYEVELRRKQEFDKLPQQLKERLEMGQNLMIEG